MRCQAVRLEDLTANVTSASKLRMASRLRIVLGSLVPIDLFCTDQDSIAIRDRGAILTPFHHASRFCREWPPFSIAATILAIT